MTVPANAENPTTSEIKQKIAEFTVTKQSEDTPLGIDLTNTKLDIPPKVLVTKVREDGLFAATALNVGMAIESVNDNIAALPRKPLP